MSGAEATPRLKASAIPFRDATPCFPFLAPYSSTKERNPMRAIVETQTF